MGESVLGNSPVFSGAHRKHGVHDKFTLELQMEGTYPELQPAARENGSSIISHRAASTDVDEESPDEQGQEVLWVENAADPSTPTSKPGTTSRKILPSSQKIAQIIADGSKSHVIVFTEPIEEAAPREPLVKMKDNVVNSESSMLITAEKVAAAKQLLEQALNEKSTHRSKDLAQEAFSLALEARNSVELDTDTSEELRTVLNDASTKGKAEVLKVQELKHHSGNKGENHASRARSLMDFILPENKVTTPKVSSEGYKLLAYTELETANSSEATFKTHTRPQDFDVFSMTSLNAILDDPEEDAAPTTFAETKMGTTREQTSNTVDSRAVSNIQCKDEATTSLKQTITDTSGESIAGERKSEEGKIDVDRKNVSRNSGLFRGLFVAKREKKNQAQNRLSETLNASVFIGHDSSRPEEADDVHANVAVIDRRAQKKLPDAITNDATETIETSKNVKIHFIQDSSASRAHAKQEQIFDGTKLVAPDRRKDADSARTLLAAAPKVHPNLHPSHYGNDSPDMGNYSLSIAGKKPILENQKRKEKHGQHTTKSRSPHKENLGCDSGSEAKSPSSPSSCDRYAVIPDNDRYDTIDSTDSFRAFLQGRDSKNVIALPALDTVSTLGTRFSNDQSPVSQRLSSHADKYQPEFALQDRDECQTPVLETVPQGGLRNLGATKILSEAFHRVVTTKASRSPTRELQKPKHEKSAKKLKRKSLAGIFGFSNASALPKSKQTPPKQMVASFLPKSEQPTKTNALPIRNTKQVIGYALPSARIHVLPNIEENGRGNPPNIQYQNDMVNAKTHCDHSASYSPGPFFHSPSTTGYTLKTLPTYSEPFKDFDHGLDKPTETDSTLSLCDAPEINHDEGESIRSEHDVTDEDPLVAHLKKQIICQPKRGLDPTSAKASNRSSRLDP